MSASNGANDLPALLASMQPVLHTEPCAFCSVSRGRRRRPEPGADRSIPRAGRPHPDPPTQAEASQLGLPFDGTWAWITLTVHSSLSAVGFLAAITTRLAGEGISVNPVSAYYHDHLFGSVESNRAGNERADGIEQRLVCNRIDQLFTRFVCGLFSYFQTNPVRKFTHPHGGVIVG